MPQGVWTLILYLWALWLHNKTASLNLTSLEVLYRNKILIRGRYVYIPIGNFPARRGEALRQNDFFSPPWPCTLTIGASATPHTASAASTGPALATRVQDAINVVSVDNKGGQPLPCIQTR